MRGSLVFVCESWSREAATKPLQLHLNLSREQRGAGVGSGTLSAHNADLVQKRFWTRHVLNLVALLGVFHRRHTHRSHRPRVEHYFL